MAAQSNVLDRPLLDDAEAGILLERTEAGISDEARASGADAAAEAPYDLDHGGLHPLRRLLVLAGLWRPRDRRAVLAWQALAFLAACSFLALQLAGLGIDGGGGCRAAAATGSASRIDAFFARARTTFRVPGGCWEMMVPGALLNALPIVAFAYCFFDLNRDLFSARADHVAAIAARVPRSARPDFERRVRRAVAALEALHVAASVATAALDERGWAEVAPSALYLWLWWAPVAAFAALAATVCEGHRCDAERLAADLASGRAPVAATYAAAGALDARVGASATRLAAFLWIQCALPTASLTALVLTYVLKREVQAAEFGQYWLLTYTGLAVAGNAISLGSAAGLTAAFDGIARAINARHADLGADRGARADVEHAKGFLRTLDGGPKCCGFRVDGLFCAQYVGLNVALVLGAVEVNMMRAPT